MVERININTIAAHFKTSTTTVSKALNGKKGVSPKLRCEILEYAKENSYIPNLYGRGLKGKTLRVIGVIISDNCNPSFAELVQGIEHCANEADYNIILCNSNENWETEKKHIGILIEKGVEGIIITPTEKQGKHEGFERYAPFQNLGVPIVFAFRTMEGCTFDVVKTDNIYGAYLATKYLIEKGHRSLLHITTNLDISTRYERIEGFRRALEEQGLPFTQDMVFTVSAYGMESSEQDVRRLLSGKRSFTGIFVFNDLLAIGAVKAMHDLGIAVPGDIAVIGFDNMYFSSVCTVPLTTVPQYNKQMGEAALQILMERVGNGVYGGRILREYRPDTVIVRNSV
jgi:LacI family transcriptional regulator